MRTETIEVLQFNELAPSAKEKARQWYREAGQHDQWWDAVFEDAKTVAALMGIEIEDIGFSGFSSQGDGAHFTGRFGYAKGCAKAVAAHAPEATGLQAIARDWQALQAANFYQLTGTVSHSGRYQHAYCTSFEVKRGDEWANDFAEDGVKEVLRDLMNWIYCQLEDEYDQLNSDEVVDENIVCNEYEFLADGTRH